MEGVFRGGLPIGRLTFYSASGRLRVVKKYSRRGKLIRTRMY
jgi:hypothetical protein